MGAALQDWVDAAQVMVGEGVAFLAATPEPRMRAFPSRGSSGCGPLSQAPCAVNDVVTVAVHQAQVVEAVVVVVGLFGSRPSRVDQ
jgi:hypothetical protein